MLSPPGTSYWSKGYNICLIVPGTIRMGSFAVDVPSFEKVALPTLQKAPHVDVYIIDEVPNMGAKTAAFSILDSFHRFRRVHPYGLVAVN